MTQDNKTKQIVRPVTLKGFCDYLPEEMIARNYIIEKVRIVYERYGFMPIDTPILEYLVTLIGTGGEAINKEIFRLESPEREPAGMRFDLTVPFARILAQYSDKIKLPFRRYHIGPVFRADKPGPGRYRQFTQFDIDAAGSESIIVDAEIIAAMCDVMREIGLSSDASATGGGSEYQVKVNSIRLMDALLVVSDVTIAETRRHVLRVVDKLSKAGIDNITKELGDGRIDDSGDPIRGVGLDSDTIDKILQFISIAGDTRASVIEQARKALPAAGCTEAALAEMEALGNALDCFGVRESEAVFQTSLTRGLDYYTGPVYEAVITGAPHIGSVMGGGRYDNLVDRFMQTQIPATGASIGIDRFIAALSHIGKINTPASTTKVLVIVMRDTPAAENMKIVRELRDSKIPAEVFLGKKNASVTEQLAYANHRAVPVAVIAGPDEIQSGTVSLKDLVAGKEKRSDINDRDQYRKSGKTGQITVAREEMISTIIDMLGDRT